MDASQPKFWDERYRAGTMPWDYGGVPPRLQRYLNTHRAGGSALIPGCGSGHEITAFAAAGYQVTGVDFSPAAVELARAHVGPALAEQVFLGDFFSRDFPLAPFDLIYERGFLCSLQPDLRPAYAQRVQRLLKPGGILVGFFCLGEKADGPPFHLGRREDEELLRQHFHLVNDERVAEPFPLFGDSERWREYRRKT